MTIFRDDLERTSVTGEVLSPVTPATRGMYGAARPVCACTGPGA